MSTQVQRRRGTTAQHSTFTGAVGELTVDTDKKTVVVHDGATAGGTPLAKESHNHTGVYEPADATILKDADIGVAVQAYDADTAKTDVEQTWTAQQTPMKGTLTDGANIDWNGDTHGQVVKLTLGGNRTMNAPTNINEGAMYALRVAQDATGSRTISWNAAYKFGGAGAPTLTTAANAVDWIFFIGGTSNTLECTGNKLNAVT